MTLSLLAVQIAICAAVALPQVSTSSAPNTVIAHGDRDLGNNDHISLLLRRDVAKGKSVGQAAAKMIGYTMIMVVVFVVVFFGIVVGCVWGCVSCLMKDPAKERAKKTAESAGGNA
jgi:hypothetical protein